MNRPRPKGRPTFFWQPVLILLPVVGLACFGLYSMRQDRLLAEQEARDSGQALAQRLAAQFSLSPLVESGALRPLFDYYNARFEANANDEFHLGLTRWANGTQDEKNALQLIKAWQLANPDIDLLSLPPAEGFLDFQPAPLTPQPPDWLAELTPEQRELWESAQELEFVSKDHAAAQSALQKFIDSNPPKGAVANAQYLLLLAKTSSDGLGTNDITALLSGRSAYSTELSQAGLPIGQLACYQVLQQISHVEPGGGVPEELLRAMAMGISLQPSMFSSQLISEAERVAAGTPSETNVASLRAWWDGNQLQRDVLEDFLDQHPANTRTNKTFWVDSSPGKFLVLLGDPVLMPTNLPGTPETRYRFMLFPRAIVAKALANAASKSGMSPPPYAGVQIEIAGENITMAQDTAATMKNTQRVLGQTFGTWENIPGSTNIYPFKVRVVLADANILYARQKQRDALFGALILASAMAAVIGLYAAYASFRRQQQLSEMKSDFVSSVSHELRAPIASVRLMAEGLERGKISEPAKQHEYFKFIVQECRRLSSLIENVLDFSRIEEGRKRYEMESTDLVALTQQTVKVMETYAAERDIHISLSITGTPAPVDLDGKAIQQALVNLIDNAIKHSSKGSIIAVDLDFNHAPANAEVARDGHSSTVLVSVEDHGEGIAASEQDKIFERFYRVGSELRRETQGVGIGLSMVKHIVEAHGGRVTVRSAPGQGSRFTIELPMNGRDGPPGRPRTHQRGVPT
jgi:signal transduction histidine kinase